jgi:hypothetical protein
MSQTPHMAKLPQFDQVRSHLQTVLLRLIGEHQLRVCTEESEE